MPDPAPATPAARFNRIIAALRGVVADHGLRCGLAGPLIILLCARLGRLATRFAAWAEAAPRARRATHRPRPPTEGTKIPRRFAWLLRVLPVSATARGQFAALLAEPDMIALIKSRPAAGRALRPLCHLLGIEPPPILRLPPRPRVPKPAPDPAPDLQPPDPGAPAAAAAPPQSPAWPKPPPRYATVFFPRRRPRSAFAP